MLYCGTLRETSSERTLGRSETLEWITTGSLGDECDGDGDVELGDAQSVENHCALGVFGVSTGKSSATGSGNAWESSSGDGEDFAGLDGAPGDVVMIVGSAGARQPAASDGCWYCVGSGGTGGVGPLTNAVEKSTAER